MSEIHPTAIVDPTARIGNNVSIGAFSCIGPDVVLGDDAILKSHVVLAGRTNIGPGAKIFPFACVGETPQDLKYGGEDTALEIGANAVIRENVTINIGTNGGGGLTKIGNNCLFMAGSHVAHDCIVGNNVIYVNNAVTAGHVIVGDYVIIGGLSAVHQFARIGHNAMIGGMTGVEADVIPFGIVTGNRAHLDGLNLVGLKRSGTPRDQIKALRNLYDQIFLGDNGTFQERIEGAKGDHSGPAAELYEFMQAETSRRYCTPERGG